MGKLDAFLHPVQVEETREVVISKRFVGKDGKPAPFVIRAISEEENAALRSACTRKVRDKGVVYTDFDADRYNRKLVLACVVEPDFAAAEMCDAYGTKDPTEVPGKMLLAGEMNALSMAIAQQSGFDVNVEDDAKNF